MDFSRIETLLPTDPLSALVEARNVLSEPRESPLPAAICRELSWASYRLCDITQAVFWLDQAQEATDILMPQELASLAGLAAAVRSAEGRPELAIPIATQLVAVDGMGVQARLLLGTLRSQTGDVEGGLHHLGVGLEAARQAGDAERAVRLLNNRGVCHLGHGALGRAEADFRSAQEIARDLAPIHLAISEHNMGVVAARRGALGRAIRLFRRVDDHIGPADAVWVSGPALLDRARVFLSSGLLAEARSAVRAAQDVFRDAGAAAQTVTALCLEARILGRLDQWTAAIESSDAARQIAVDADLSSTMQQETFYLDAVLRRIASLEVDSPTTPAIVETTEQLAIGAYPELAIDLALRLAEAQQVDEAAGTLRDIQGSLGGRVGLERLHSAVADVLAAVVSHDRTQTWRLASKALHAVGDEAVFSGSSSVRGSALRRVRQLRDLGLGAAVADGEIENALGLFTQARLLGLAPEPVLSERETVLVARLRGLEASLGARPLGQQRRVELLQSRIECEAELRTERMIREPETDSKGGHNLVRRSRPPTLSIVALQDEVLFLWAAFDGDAELLGRADRGHYSRLARAVQVAAQFAPSGLGPPLSEFAKLLRPALDRIEQAVPVPSRRSIANEQVAVIVDAALPSPPWSLLTRVPVVIPVPQAVVASGRSRGGHISSGRMVVVAGPDLAHAEQEVETISGLREGTEVLIGADARADAVIEAFAGADAVHLATHGVFRSDNPLASSLMLVDGPLSFFDLLGRTAVPRLIVFSACSVGRGASSSPIGLASLLFHRGCEALIASSGVIPDAHAASLHTDFYRQLHKGYDIAPALRAAQKDALPTAPALSLISAFGPG